MLHEKLIIPRLETHVHHHCNLKCDNCNHFSNYGIKSNEIAASDYETWNKPWSKKLIPKVYQLCGGEPTLNTNLAEICSLSRQIWTKSKILLVTNGFFLHKHKQLPQILQDNKIKLVVSVHDNSIEYQKKLDVIKSLIATWLESFSFEIDYRESYSSWFKTFKVNENNQTVPYADNKPNLSYSNCLSKNAKQIFNGLIYKCPPLAYLNLVNEKFKLSKDWDFYLNYKPLEPNCTQQELKAFFSLESESYCNMCAANPEKYKKPDPLVQIKTNF